MANQMDYEINKELGECYLFMGDLDKAEGYYRKAAGAAGSESAPFMGLATIAVQRGELDNAMTLYGKALSVEKNDKALAGMGLVKMERGEHEEAFDLFKQALEFNPGNAVALNCIVREAYTLKRQEALVPILEASLKAEEIAEEVRVALAGCLMSLGRKDEAARYLDEVLASNPEHAAARELKEHLA